MSENPNYVSPATPLRAAMTILVKATSDPELDSSDFPTRTCAINRIHHAVPALWYAIEAVEPEDVVAMCAAIREQEAEEQPCES